MSSLEPQTRAQVILRTTKGSIQIDLWPKELPNTCRDFISNCLNQKFNELTFSANSNFIELPNPNKTKFVKESNLRIKCKRGYVGLNQSGDSLLITLKEIPDFVNYNIFGKISQESYYNALKISQGEVDEDGNPIFPVKVISSVVIESYFDDLVKKVEEEPEEPVKKKPKTVVKMNYDDHDDEEEYDDEEEFKIKSAFELRKDTSKKLDNKQEVQEIPIPESNRQQQKIESEEPNKEEVVIVAEAEEEVESKLPLTRDPTIDSEYDSDLDLDNAESIALSKSK